MALIFVGAALGIDWAKIRERMTLPDGQKADTLPVDAAPAMPSIAELAASIKTPPVPGITLAASVEALKRLKAPAPVN